MLQSNTLATTPLGLFQNVQYESKILQYFGKMWKISAASDAFAELIKVTNILYCEMPNLPDTLQVYLYGLEQGVGNYSFRLTWSCLIITVFEKSRKIFEPSIYSSVINCTFTFYRTNVFACF